eukprot:6529759-Alexandrium_andersonii.AAC.1
MPSPGRTLRSATPTGLKSAVGCFKRCYRFQALARRVRPFGEGWAQSRPAGHWPPTHVWPGGCSAS